MVLRIEIAGLLSRVVVKPKNTETVISKLLNFNKILCKKAT